MTLIALMVPFVRGLLYELTLALLIKHTQHSKLVDTKKFNKTVIQQTRKTAIPLKIFVLLFNVFFIQCFGPAVVLKVYIPKQNI